MSKSYLNPSKKDSSSLENSVRGYLSHFYKNFDSYDQIIFPINYETPIGEGNTVEVARISPADAVNLIDEEKDANKRKKLAGDTFFSFSAFFAENWRKNDIMWGRRDAVERLAELMISGNNPSVPSEFKKIFITQAQRSILNENSDLFPRKDDLFEYVKSDYRVDRTLNQTSIMKTTARTFGVSAKVLQSRIETSKDGKLGFEKPNSWLRYSADFVKPLALMIEVSTNSFSLRNTLSFLLAPFQLGWLSVLFLFLLLLLSGIWLLGFSFLTDVVALWSLPLGDESQEFFSAGEKMRDVLSNLKSNIQYKWILGFIFVVSSFYSIFFLLTYIVKNYIFQKLAKRIIG